LEYRFYELTGDLPEALHFRHFEHNPEKTQPVAERIRLKSEVHSSDSPAGSIRSRIRIKDADPVNPAPVKTASGQIKLKQGKKEKIKSKKVSEPTSMRVRYTSVERSNRPMSKLGRGRVKVCKI
jgi:hypothetical protein